ncbi:hypothetical protein GCM10007860_21430 [Chitiniphilus shinanonensis]|uniref:SPOR domain-containing protein n=2 Tax=Chitiniphilus shinanonensis TaxID=553088 RepID=A0ABQ6BTQ5_9NEIS|nr:hypothetical protein GCM10007860_21430 [Chitiniphilus shinanonensis]
MLVVLVLLFGTLLFLAGVFAPASVRGSLGRGATDTLQAVSRLPLGDRLTAGLLPAKPAAKQATASAPADASAPPAIPAEQIVLPAIPPAKAEYALQATQRADYREAQELVTQAQAEKLPASVITIAEDDGQHWYVVAIGKYASVEDARSGRVRVAQRLNLTGGLPVILLPAPPKKK